VEWGELGPAIRKAKAEMLFFSPEKALARAEKHGDLFAPVLQLKQRLPEVFRKVRGRTVRGGGLEQYAAKRVFEKTNEPGPEKPRRSAQGSRRRFVIQKHAAQHLHYDFRLEMQDVLKSWAVPKGIPLQNGERRSAFGTEDHPVEYLEFEGVIPKGQYGGGTVMVWDIGTYEKMDGNYYQGELRVYLSGRKCKGEWTLKRLEEEESKAVWLLIKTGGDAKRVARKQADISALSGRSMEEIAGQRTAVWQSNRARKKETAAF
jgi:bifunctional non-homologous end joining protein LigD